jgi:predicted TIM-barrel fold metal-dependent hydrolase
MITAQQALTGLEKLGLDEDATSFFLGSNAQRVFRL